MLCFSPCCCSCSSKDIEPTYTNVDGLQFWLLGYEFPATLFVFTLDAMYIVTTVKKGELARKLGLLILPHLADIELFPQSKTS